MNLKPIYFHLRRVDKEENADLDRSKICGSPVVPKDFLDDKLTDDDYFVGQINLSELKDFDTPLPKVGFLYFFIDVETNETKVFYTDEEPIEVVDDINEGFDKYSYGDTRAMYMEFDPNLDEGNYLLGEAVDDESLQGLLTTNKAILMCLDSLFMPQIDKALLFAYLAPYDGYYVFGISKDDLKKNDFSKVIFYDWGS